MDRNYHHLDSAFKECNSNSTKVRKFDIFIHSNPLFAPYDQLKIYSNRSVFFFRLVSISGRSILARKYKFFCH